MIKRSNTNEKKVHNIFGYINIGYIDAGYIRFPFIYRSIYRNEKIF